MDEDASRTGPGFVTENMKPILRQWLLEGGSQDLIHDLIMELSPAEWRSFAPDCQCEGLAAIVKIFVSTM